MKLRTGVQRGALLLILVAAAAEYTASSSDDSASSYLARTVTGVSDALHLMSNALGLGASKRPAKRITLINVGIGRTGTKSFITALEQLGYTPIHDDVFGEVADLFGRIFDQEDPFSSADWANAAGERGFDAMGSAVMLPYEFVQWAVNERDDIKVVLTLRDNPRKWAESWISVNYAIDLFESRPFVWIPAVQQILPAADHEFRHVCTNGKPDMDKDPDTLVEGYEAHQERIRQIVPPEKLLEFNVKQGWKPLCQFLNKTVPDTKFPHVNDRVVMKALLGTLWVITWTWPILAFLVLYSVWLACRSLFRLVVMGGSRKSTLEETKKQR